MTVTTYSFLKDMKVTQTIKISQGSKFFHCLWLHEPIFPYICACAQFASCNKEKVVTRGINAPQP
jgi:hypothetical protein